MPQKRYDGLRFARIVRAKPKDVVTRDSKRRGRAALTDYQDIVRIRVWLDHGDFGTRLRPDDNLYSAPVEIRDGVERT